MNISVEHQPGCKASLKTEVPADRVKKERDTIIKQFAKQVKMPGFRPGKVPKNLIEKKYQKEIEGSIIDNLVDAALKEAAENDDLKVLEVGQLKEKHFGADEGLSFTLEVTTVPEFEIPEYEGLKLRVPNLEVKDENIDAVIADVCKQYTDFIDAEEGKALAMGDLAVLDYEGSIDGVALEDFSDDVGTYLASGKDQWMKLEEEGFLPGFCNGLVDAKVGDKVEVPIALEEEFPVEAIAGMEVLYTVEIKGVKEESVPEFNDELAAKIEEGATVESLRERIVENLTGENEKNIRTLKVNSVVEQVSDGPAFDLPESIVMAETQERVNELAHNAQERGASEDELVNNQAAIIDYAGQQAQFNVRSAFILDKIADKEEVEVPEQELGMAVANIAQQQGVNMKKAVREMKKNGTLRRLHHDLRMQKTIELLIEKAEIEEVPQEEWEAEQAELQAAQEAEQALAQEEAAKAAAEAETEAIEDSPADEAGDEAGDEAEATEQES